MTYLHQQSQGQNRLKAPKKGFSSLSKGPNCGLLTAMNRLLAASSTSTTALAGSQYVVGAHGSLVTSIHIPGFALSGERPRLALLLAIGCRA
jgi:hypothetical protein